MNILFNLCLSTLASVGVFGVYRKYSSPQTLKLNEALTKGLISCKAIGTGTFNGPSVKLELQNTSASELRVVLPKGTLFFPTDNGEQTLITLENQLVTLSPYQKGSSTILAYCSEHSDRSPKFNTSFTLGNTKNAKFDSLFIFMKENKIPEHACQAVVWAISDNSPVSNIPIDNKQLKNLRKFLFKLTQQEEVSYTVESMIETDSQGNILERPIQLRGNIDLESTKTKWIQQEVYSSNGKMKYKSDLSFQIPKGTSNYSFILGVNGWPRGKYIMKLKSGPELVSNYSFTI